MSKFKVQHDAINFKALKYIDSELKYKNCRYTMQKFIDTFSGPEEGSLFSKYDKDVFNQRVLPIISYSSEVWIGLIFLHTL